MHEMTHLGIFKHQMNTVHLIDRTSAGIIIDRHNITLRIFIFDLTHHSFSHDVIRQAAKRLRTDNIVDALIHQFADLTGQQPAFTHLDTFGNNALTALDDLCEWCWFDKSRIFFNPGIQLINNKAKSIKFIRAAKK